MDMVLKVADELLQEDVAVWNRAYVQMPRVGMAEQRQASLQAAILAKWVVSPATAVERRIDGETGAALTVYLFDGVPVGKMRAGDVMRLGKRCEDLFAEATSVADSKN